MQPLAERMRPRTLDDYIGQNHLVGEDAVGKDVGLDDVGQFFVREIVVVRDLTGPKLALGRTDCGLNGIDATVVISWIKTERAELRREQVGGLLGPAEQAVCGGSRHPDPGVAARVEFADGIGAVHEPAVLRVRGRCTARRPCHSCAGRPCWFRELQFRPLRHA